MKLLLLLLATTASAYSNAQESTGIQSWAATHPDVYIVELQTYNSFTEDFKSKIDGNVVVYNGELNLELLESFDQMKSAQVNGDADIKGSGDEEIKEWLGAHADVKIIKRSYYNTCDAATQELYSQIGALILIGESLTLEDIRNY